MSQWQSSSGTILTKIKMNKFHVDDWVKIGDDKEYFFGKIFEIQEGVTHPYQVTEPHYPNSSGRGHYEGSALTELTLPEQKMMRALEDLDAKNWERYYLGHKPMIETVKRIGADYMITCQCGIYIKHPELYSLLRTFVDHGSTRHYHEGKLEPKWIYNNKRPQGHEHYYSRLTGKDYVARCSCGWTSPCDKSYRVREVYFEHLDSLKTWTDSAGNVFDVENLNKTFHSNMTKHSIQKGTLCQCSICRSEPVLCRSCGMSHVPSTNSCCDKFDPEE